MFNRTHLPVNLDDYPEHIAFALQTGALRRAYLGDAAGHIEVLANGTTTEHYGKVYIRLLENSEGGTRVLGQAIEASVSPNVNYTFKNNLPILVRLVGANGAYRVESVDELASRRAGYNTHNLNPMHPANTQFWLRQARDGRLFATATADNDSTTVSVEPFIYHFDGSLYDGGKANNVDLAAWMPGTTQERLVLIGENVINGSVQFIATTPRVITDSKYSLSDIAPLTYQFNDYTVPLRAVKLAGNAATVLEKDLHQDLRQFINVPQPQGVPLEVRRDYTVVENRQEFYAECSVDTGILQIDGLLVEY